MNIQEKKVLEDHVMVCMTVPFKTHVGIQLPVLTILKAFKR